MTADALLSLQARRDLTRAIQRIAADNPDAAERLNNAVLEAARQLGSNPLLGRAAPPSLLPKYRFWSLPKFNFLLVYDPAMRPVLILRCVHTSRDLPRALSGLRR